MSWYFVVQAVVIDDDRGLAPIARSAALVRGNWWRSAGVGLAFFLLERGRDGADRRRLRAARHAANSDAVLVVGEIIADAVTLPFLAIGATLYYLQLREACGGACRAADGRRPPHDVSALAPRGPLVRASRLGVASLMTHRRPSSDPASSS